MIEVDNATFKKIDHASVSRFKLLLWYLTNIVFFQNPLNPVSSLKVFLLRAFGATVGNGVMIKPSVNIKYPWKLTIGDNAWIGEGVWLDNLVDVKIGESVCISQGAMILTGNHDYKKSTFDLTAKAIILEKGVWIGAQSIVAPGVTCLSHAILAAGSVATKNLDAFGIYQGNPAVFVRKRKISE